MFFKGLKLPSPQCRYFEEGGRQFTSRGREGKVENRADRKPKVEMDAVRVRVRSPSNVLPVPLYARKFTTDAAFLDIQLGCRDKVCTGDSAEVEVSPCAPCELLLGPSRMGLCCFASCQCHTRKRTIPFPFGPPSILPPPP